jgi:hypothetical protein
MRAPESERNGLPVQSRRILLTGSSSYDAPPPSAPPGSAFDRSQQRLRAQDAAAAAPGKQPYDPASLVLVVAANSEYGHERRHPQVQAVRDALQDVYGADCGGRSDRSRDDRRWNPAKTEEGLSRRRRAFEAAVASCKLGTAERIARRVSRVLRGITSLFTLLMLALLIKNTRGAGAPQRITFWQWVQQVHDMAVATPGRGLLSSLLRDARRAFLKATAAATAEVSDGGGRDGRGSLLSRLASLGPAIDEVDALPDLMGAKRMTPFSLLYAARGGMKGMQHMLEEYAMVAEGLPLCKSATHFPPGQPKVYDKASELGAWAWVLDSRRTPMTGSAYEEIVAGPYQEYPGARPACPALPRCQPLPPEQGTPSAARRARGGREEVREAFRVIADFKAWRQGVDMTFDGLVGVAVDAREVAWHEIELLYELVDAVDRQRGLQDRGLRLFVMRMLGETPASYNSSSRTSYFKHLRGATFDVVEVRSRQEWEKYHQAA